MLHRHWVLVVWQVLALLPPLKLNLLLLLPLQPCVLQLATLQSGMLQVLLTLQPEMLQVLLRLPSEMGPVVLLLEQALWSALLPMPTLNATDRRPLDCGCPCLVRLQALSACDWLQSAVRPVVLLLKLARGSVLLLLNASDKRLLDCGCLEAGMHLVWRCDLNASGRSHVHACWH